MANTLDRKYIKDHMAHVHTPDSWGRAVQYFVLESAAQAVGNNTVPSATVNAVFHVTPIESKGCIQICIDTPFGPICTHVGV